MPCCPCLCARLNLNLAHQFRTPTGPTPIHEAVLSTLLGLRKEGLSAYGRSMKKLSAAMLGTDAEALDAALREAEAAGVGQELLQRARQRWKELGEKEREEKDQEQAARMASDAVCVVFAFSVTFW